MTFSRVLRCTALLLIPALLTNTSAFATNKPIDAAAMKQKIVEHGVGHGVRVTLADKTEDTGLIVSIGDQDFTLKAKGWAQSRTIEYAQLTGVHRDHLSTGVKVGIGVVVVGGFLGIIAGVMKSSHSVGGVP